MFIPELFKSKMPKKKTKEELDDHFKEVEKVGLEKGDFPAMVIAALITFLPVLIIAIVVIYGLMWLLVIR